MRTSVFDLFKIGVGPSSSHTVGPMVAAGRFVTWLADEGALAAAAHVTVDLYGSLALTGKGHGTDIAVIAGLAGEHPAETDAAAIARIVAAAATAGRLALGGGGPAVAFDPVADLRFRQRERLPFHSNALTFTALDAAGGALCRRTYYSIGGGFVVDEAEAGRPPEAPAVAIPYPFASGAELLAMAAASGLGIPHLMRANEIALRPPAAVDAGLDRIAAAMSACIDAGMVARDILPGGLRLRRRAARLAEDIAARRLNAPDPLETLDLLNLWAMAVNEENAGGGRVVTAPTNGAAGIIPSVIRYYERVCGGTQDGVRIFLLAAGAIGALYRRNASISGAEVGCQGEVGVACSMAAAGLSAALGGTDAQIEHAAEIGMEHNLGLTCDPVGGLVQIPCIERNAIGAAKAVNASRLAMMGHGEHLVTLDQVIETMRQTGRDMATKYKETSEGGLAVNVVEC